MAIIFRDFELQVNQLVSHVYLKLDYSQYLSKKRKLIVVEGSTDDAFIQKIKEDSVDCIVAANVFKSNDPFRSNSIKTTNCKEAIVTIITGLCRFPSVLIKNAKDIEKWDLYGLVDADYDDADITSAPPRLFITDTHDLETLLLSTDKELISRLEECEIPASDLYLAYHLAYQLAMVRQELKGFNDNLNLQIINCGSNQVNFGCFIETDKISVPNIIKYIGERQEPQIPSSKIKIISTAFCSTKNIKKKVDAQGLWKQSVGDFQKSIPLDFWKLVNGHDILQLLMYINESAAMAYGAENSDRLNRNFELRLIAAYDLPQFRKTKLYEKMSQFEVVQQL